MLLSVIVKVDPEVTYCLRKDISKGLGSTKGNGRKGETDDVCADCTSLIDLRDIFHSFVSSSSDLKKRVNTYPKPRGSVYCTIKEHNKFLMKTVVDGKGN